MSGRTSICAARISDAFLASRHVRSERSQPRWRANAFEKCVQFSIGRSAMAVGFESTATCWNSPNDLGAVKCVATEMPPAL